MSRKELVKSVTAELLRVAKETGIDISKMPEEDFSKWIGKLVKQFWE